MVESQQCIPALAPHLAGNIAKTLTDLIITTLPIPVVLRMQMALPQRVGVICLFGLGYFVTFVGGVRTYYVYRALTDPLWDQTWWQYPAFLCAAVENDLAIVSFPPESQIFALES